MDLRMMPLVVPQVPNLEPFSSCAPISFPHGSSQVTGPRTASSLRLMQAYTVVWDIIVNC